MRYYTVTPSWRAAAQKKALTMKKPSGLKKGRDISFLILCAVFITVLSGCAFYRPMPLTTEAVQKKLKIPSSNIIRIKASQIEHPILKPVPFDERNGLSPDEAAILAVIVNPSLRVVRDVRGLAAAQVLQAGILPNPKISSSFEIPIGGNRVDEVNGFSLGIDWDIGSLVARNARISAARSFGSSIDLEVAWQEWQLAEAAKLHVFRLLIAKKSLSLTREAENFAERYYKTEKKAVATGMETIGRLSSAQAIFHQARTNFLRAKLEVNSECLELNRVLGLPSNSNIKLEEGISLPTIEHIPPIQELIKDIEKRRLDLLALRQGYKSQEERLRAAIQSQFPKINIGLFRAKDPEGINVFGVGLSISFPIFNRNQGKIALERATRQRLFDEYVARIFEARSNIVKIVENMHSILQQLKNDRKALHEMQLLAERYHKAVKQGNLSVTEYYRVMFQLYIKKLDKLALQRRLVDFAVALEIASGRYIFTSHKPGGRTLKPVKNWEDKK